MVIFQVIRLYRDKEHAEVEFTVSQLHKLFSANHGFLFSRTFSMISFPKNKANDHCSNQCVHEVTR